MKAGIQWKCWGINGSWDTNEDEKGLDPMCDYQIIGCEIPNLCPILKTSKMATSPNLTDTA